MFHIKQMSFISLMSVLSLTACTDNGVLFRSFGWYEHDSKATYKIGESYQIKDEWYTPQEDYSYSAKGVASWYQEENGKLTSNGEKYDENLLSATHKTLPLPSMVRVTNLENGNVAIVRVNDRGPFVNNRLIDVSQKTAQQLEFNMTGTTLVQVEILPTDSKRLKNELLRRNGGQMEIEEESTSGASVLSSAVAIEDLSTQPIYQPTEEVMEVYNPKQKATEYNDEMGMTDRDTPAQEIENVNTRMPRSMNRPQKLTDSKGNMSDEVIDKPTPVSESSQASKFAPVEQIVPLQRPVSGHYIQVGAYSQAQNAEVVKEQLSVVSDAQIFIADVNKSKLHRVRVGPFESREEAAELLDKLSNKGYGDAKIIFEP